MVKTIQMLFHQDKRKCQVLILYLFQLLILACGQITENGGALEGSREGEQNLVLVCSDTLMLTLDSTAAQFSYVNNIAEIEDTSLLVYYYDYLHQVTFFNLVTGASHSVKLIEDGPKSVDVLQNIYVHNEDSIFGFSMFVPNKLNLINRDGELVDSWSFSQKGPFSHQYLFGAIDYYDSFGFFYDDSSKCIYTRFLPVNVKASQKEFYKSPLGAVISLHTGEMVAVYGSYPKEIQENGIYRPSAHLANQVIHDGRIFISFPHAHELYIYGMKPPYNLQGSLTARSGHMPRSFPVFNDIPKIKDFQQFDNYHRSSPKYVKLLSDGKYLYRFSKHEQAVYRSDDGKLTTWDESPFSILAVNPVNGEVLDELVLPRSTYNPDLVFVTSEGLWIGMNTMANPITRRNEGVLAITLFRLQKQ